jgi:hypothetical protein
MKLRSVMISASLLAFVLCGGPTPGRAESVFVKYRGDVSLNSFDCTDIARSTFINRVCYDQRNEYMLISLNGTFYHYCEIDVGTVSSLLNAPSMGTFYNASIKSNFDCRVHRVPEYGGPVQPSPQDQSVYVPQPGSPGDHFGAIAFSNSSGAIGYSYDHSSGNDAQQSALRECGYGCKVVMGFTNACGALAVGTGRGYGTGWAETRQGAESTAMSYCSSRTTGCDIVKWVCTTR